MAAGFGRTLAVTLAPMSDHDQVIAWLLGSDPAIRWQTLRDVQGAPEAVWRAERAKVESEGWGALLLSHQDADGQWAGGSFLPRGFEPREWKEVGQPWTASSFVLSQLRELGLDPATERARWTVEQLGRNCRWDEGGQPFWEGETEACINGRLVADGAYFGADVQPVVERLLAERQPDGGWNCARQEGSTRSSFHSTINVLEGLLEHERATGGTPDTREARASGEEYLLERRLFRRLSTGAPADERFLGLVHPNRWRYDVLRALDYFRSAAALTGARPDPRLGEAVDHVRSRRSADGTWPLDWSPPGRVWFEMEAPGRPSRWLTLRAMRVLQWWEAEAAGGPRP